MKALSIFEFAFAAVIAYIGYLQVQLATSQAATGLNPAASYLMAFGSLVASLLLVAVAIHALRTNKAHRGTHALPFIILALTASASLFVGRGA